MKAKEMSGAFARRLAACAMTAPLAALSFPHSAFTVDSAKLSLHYFTAESSVVMSGDASAQVLLMSTSDSYSLERNGEKQEIRLAMPPDAVCAWYGVDSACAGQATVNLYGNGTVKINALQTARAIL